MPSIEPDQTRSANFPINRPGRSCVAVVGNFLSGATGTPGACEGLADMLEQSGWSVLRTSSRPHRIPRLYDMMRTLLKHRGSYSAAIVEVYSGPAFVWAELVSALLASLGCPCVLVLRGGGIPEFSETRKRRVRRMLTSAAAVTTPSHFLRACLSDLREDIRHIPNGMDLEHFSCRVRRHPAPRLVWLRAFHAMYNPQLAVKSLALLVGDFPDISLTMLGPDKGDGSLAATERLAERLGVSGKVNIAGAVDHAKVPDMLGQHDIFLNTTFLESFGKSVMEAAASGLCIVTTGVGEIPHLWTSGHDALLVPPDNEEAMASSIRSVLNDHVLSEKLSRNARAKAEQYGWENILTQWESLLRDIHGSH